jgi:hypothetical protein
MDLEKLRYVKHFSIVIVMYVWFIITVLYDGILDVWGKICWIEFLVLLCCFSYRLLWIVVKIERMLKDNDND